MRCAPSRTVARVSKDEATELLGGSPLKVLLAQKGGTLALREALAVLSAICVEIAGMHQDGKSHGALDLDAVRIVRLDNGSMNAQLTGSLPGAMESDDLSALASIAFTLLLGRGPKANETLGEAMPNAPAGLERLMRRLSTRDGSAPTADEAWGELSALRAALGEAPAAIRSASPLSAPPQLKRGAPARAEPDTASHAWVKDRDEATSVMPPEPPRALGYVDDEPTATEMAPPHDLGKDDDDAPTVAMAPREKQRPKSHEPDTLDPDEKPRKHNTFIATHDDVPPSASKPLLKYPAPPLKRPREAVETPQERLMRLARQQPPWVWGALGAGFALIIVLLIAAIR